MKSSLIRLLALLPLASAPCLPALAADSDWLMSDGGRMRISALSTAEDGHARALLEIEPAPGWKTYWRDPGDAGMPPEIDISASQNLTIRSVSFPVPEFADDADGHFIGYHGPARLLIDFDRPATDAPSTLDAKVLIGLCKEICLPVQGAFTLPVTPESDDDRHILAAAGAMMPEAPGEDFKLSQISGAADRTSIEFTLQLPSEAKPEYALVPDPGLRFRHPFKVEQTGRMLRVTASVRKWPKDGKPAQMTLLVKSGDRAMETRLFLP